MSGLGEASTHRQPARASERRDAGGGAESRNERERWVEAKAVAKHLAVTEFWVREMAKQGEIPATKIGAYWRFRISEIDTAMTRRRSLVHRRRA